MAAGDLSADQRRFRDLVVSATGLDAAVVTSWIGAESGWNVTKAGHNYLNIGPGRVYSSTTQAAAATASLIGTSGHYKGIRSAIPAGGVAQVDAIAASPWGTKRDSLAAVYGQISGAPMATAAGGLELPGALRSEPVSWRVPGTGVEIPDPLGWLTGKALDAAGDAAAAPAKAVMAGLATLIGPVFELFLETGLRLVFTIAGLGLVALGLNRLTGSSLREGYGALNAVTGQAATVSKIAS